MRALLTMSAAALAAGVLAATVLGARAATEQIAFTKNRAIWVIGADGSGLRRLTHSSYSDGDISWSHDGTIIAFTRFLNQSGCPENQGRGDLYLTDGKSERR